MKSPFFINNKVQQKSLFFTINTSFKTKNFIYSLVIIIKDGLIVRAIVRWGVVLGGFNNMGLAAALKKFLLNLLVILANSYCINGSRMAGISGF